MIWYGFYEKQGSSCVFTSIVHHGWWKVLDGGGSGGQTGVAKEECVHSSGPVGKKLRQFAQLRHEQKLYATSGNSESHFQMTGTSSAWKIHPQNVHGSENSESPAASFCKWNFVVQKLYFVSGTSGKGRTIVLWT